MYVACHGLPGAVLVAGGKGAARVSGVLCARRRGLGLLIGRDGGDTETFQTRA